MIRRVDAYTGDHASCGSQEHGHTAARRNCQQNATASNPRTPPSAPDTTAGRPDANAAMTALTDNRWRDARLIGLVEGINDQCQRVTLNGPEPTYAGEKLEVALHQLARALVITGMTPTEIRDAAADAARKELDRW